MVARDPSRPKAAHIPDLAILTAVETYGRIGAPYPSEPFIEHFPPKVVASKLHKLHRRGLINEKRLLTREGRFALDSIREAVDA